MKDVSAEIRIGAFLCFQMLALIYIGIVKPFENVRENLIEFLNDSCYVMLVVILYFLTQIDNPKTGVSVSLSTFDMVMVYIVIMDCMLIGIIVFVDLIRLGIIRFVHKNVVIKAKKPSRVIKLNQSY